MIHKYSMHGLNIVLDVDSGSVHAVDDIVFDTLDYYKSYTDEQILDMLSGKYLKTEIEEALSEIKILEKSGQLYTEFDYSSLTEKVSQRTPVVKALCLHVAHDCNLKCEYCFAKEGEYNGERSIMSLDVAKAAVDFVIKNSGSRKNIEVDMFGGEPLMNFEVVKETIAYARSLENKYNKRFRFTLTTNGMLLDENTEEYIMKEMDNVVLSLDGRKEVNDKMRKRYNNGSSYDHIIPKFQSLAEKRKQSKYYVRGTFTRENLDFCNDILHMAELGFKQISVEPVVAGAEKDYSIRLQDVEQICGEYEKLAKYMSTHPKEFNFFHFMIDLTGGPCAIKRVTGCGAGTEYLAVTPEGDLFPCHQFVNEKDFRMGSVYEGIIDHEIADKFSNISIFSKQECNTCFAKFFCSGGCAANAYQFNKDVNSSYEIGCHLQRKRVECALFLKVNECLY